jgi:hypothetical protein
VAEPPTLVAKRKPFLVVRNLLFWLWLFDNLVLEKSFLYQLEDTTNLVSIECLILKIEE